MVSYQVFESQSGGYHVSDSYYGTHKGVLLKVVENLKESPYNWINGVDEDENSILLKGAYNINYSPTIMAASNTNDISKLDAVQKQFQFVTDNGTNKVAKFIKELYISSKEIDLSDVTFTIFRLFKYSSTGIICCGLMIESSIKEDGWYFEIPGARDEEGGFTELIGSGYYCFTTSNGINFEFVIDWENNPYNYNDTFDSVVINRYAYNINYSPTINSIRNANKTIIKGKKGYFIGDSIMIGHDEIETTLSITHFLTERYGMNCVNKAKGGAVLTSSTKHHAPIYQMLTSIPDDADYIIMQGGVNGMTKEVSDNAPWGWGNMSDSYETEFDTIFQIPCLEAMCKYVITHFPTKKYGFIITYKISNWYDYWDEKSELIKQVLEKWGIPYLDWRQCGITLASQAVREQYGVDAFASYPEYSSSNTYSTDDRVLYQGKAYKAKQDINTPEDWTPVHWDLITDTRYDGWHCNSKAYEQLADKTAAWMMNL